MSSHRLVRKVHLVLISVIFTLVISSPSIGNHGYFDVTKAVYGQSDPDQMSRSPSGTLFVADKVFIFLFD